MHCPICLESLAADSSPVVSTPCGHLFHELCLAAVPESGGSEESRRCPTCRAEYIRRYASMGMGMGNLGSKALRRVYLDSGELPITADDAQREIILLRAQLKQIRGIRQQEAEETEQLKHRLSETQDQLRNLKIREDDAVAALGSQLTDARERLRKAEKRAQSAMQRTKVIGEALSEERAKRRAAEEAHREQVQKLRREVNLLNKDAQTLSEALTHESAVSAGLRRKLATQEAKSKQTARPKTSASSALSPRQRVHPSDIVSFEPAARQFSWKI